MLNIFTSKIFKYTVLAAIFFLSLQVTFAAESGSITGIIVDAESGEPMIGANVLVEGTIMGASTDMDGYFKIEPVPVGTYSVVATMIGFADVRVEGIKVEAGKPADLDFTMTQQMLQGEVVVVEAKALTNTEGAMLKHRQKAVAVSDAVSSEMMKQSGSGNAAEAMKQVTGASVVDGKYIFVRGLGSRYTSTQLNGAEIPSVDPYKRAGSIDLIPTNMIDNIQTVKSFTPDKQGNFSGGAVDIHTKDFPEKLTMSFSSSSSMNTQTTFDNTLFASSSSTDWLGKDDGSRDIPNAVGDSYWERPTDYFRNEESANEIDKVTKAFSKKMAPGTNRAPINQSYALSIGNQINLFGRPLGFIGSLTYKNKVSSYTNGKYNRWDNASSDWTKATLDTNFALIDSKSTYQVLWGAVLKGSYKFHPLHMISVNGLYNQNGENTARYLYGSYPYDLNAEDTYEARSQHYKERTLKSIQFNGEHNFPFVFGSTLEWKSSFMQLAQNEPDIRFFYNYLTEDGSYGIKSNLKPERYFRYMNENQKEFSVDYSVPFKQWNGKSGKIKMGGFYSQKDRDFRERRFQYQDMEELNVVFRDSVNGDIDAMFENHTGIDNQRTLPNGMVLNYMGIYIEETDQTSSNYDGTKDISAGYFMFNLPLMQRLRTIAGFRAENTNMSVQSQDTTEAVARVKTEDILPSFNMIYQMHKNMNMRFAYSTTLARPTFREISTFTSYDFNGGDTYIGNPDLKRTLINNFDLRWEWFFNPGEIVALSLFSKRFKNPIEVVITDAINKEVSWENADQADVTGLEFELRKKLSMFSNSLKDLTVGGNISLISSEVDIVKDTAVVYETDKKSTRSFQGQSPYILNLFVNYSNFKHGISSALYYNVFGKRLAAVGSLGVPDVYEEPFHLLNFNISKQLFNNWKVQLAANNLLNWNVKKTQEYKNRSYTYSQYNRGIGFTVGISYTL